MPVFQGTYAIDFEDGGEQFGSVQIEYVSEATWQEANGDGWNEPREPAHWEVETFVPETVTFYHCDGLFTRVGFDEESILGIYFQALLNNVQRIELEEGLNL